MEFPSDPWQHYARVNEWSWLQVVTEHSEWKKSSYLLAYSLIGHFSPPAHQLKWFDAYYTGCCLLVCWQYYRLARATGLSERAAFSFVLIQAVAFGNSVFGFYRYYGMSSSLHAQLGAIALIRFALEIARLGGLKAPANGAHGASSLFGRAAGNAGVALALLLLTAFSHVQGLGIAALGVAAVIGWRLLEWRRSSIWWLLIGAVGLSAAAILWLPRNPLLDQAYRQQGWLTSWYGFNLFEPGSPASNRAATILGVFGLVNILASLLLIRRNQIAAWLTLFPPLALCLSVVAIPFANALTTRAEFLDSGYIIAFSRMLFAIPVGLALVTLGTQTRLLVPPDKSGPIPGNTDAGPDLVRAGAVFPLFLVGLFALVTAPATDKYYNRLYNALMVPPGDLAMKHVVASNEVTAPVGIPKLPDSGETRALNRIVYGSILTTPGIGYVLNATGNTLIRGARKWMTWPSVTPPSLNTSLALQNLQFVDTTPIHRARHWPVPSLFSPGSITGALSGHWLQQEVALEHAAQTELFAPAPSTSRAPRAPQIWLEWWFDDKADQRFSGRGPVTEAKAPSLDDRGRLEGTDPSRVIRQDDLLTFRPVMRTPDGNGWRIILTIRHPASSSEQQFTGLPSRLGGDSWLYGDHQIRAGAPGQYEVEITGITLLPKATFVVRYHFIVLPPGLSGTAGAK